MTQGFETASFKTTRSALLETLADHNGFVLVEGAPGSGKSLLKQQLQTKLKARYLLIDLPYSRFDVDELLATIAAAMKLKYRKDDPDSCLEAVQQRAASQLRSGKPIALLIDDAQLIPEQTLTSLASAVGGDQPLLPLRGVLFAAPGLYRQLELKHIERTLLSKRLRLASPTEEEMKAFVRYILQQAGDNQFEINAPALAELLVQSAGSFRKAEQLVALAAREADLSGSKQITPAVIASILEESCFSEPLTGSSAAAYPVEPHELNPAAGREDFDPTLGGLLTRSLLDTPSKPKLKTRGNSPEPPLFINDLAAAEVSTRNVVEMAEGSNFGEQATPPSPSGNTAPPPGSGPTGRSPGPITHPHKGSTAEADGWQAPALDTGPQLTELANRHSQPAEAVSSNHAPLVIALSLGVLLSVSVAAYLQWSLHPDYSVRQHIEQLQQKLSSLLGPSSQPSSVPSGQAQTGTVIRSTAQKAPEIEDQPGPAPESAARVTATPEASKPAAEQPVATDEQPVEVQAEAAETDLSHLAIGLANGDEARTDIDSQLFTGPPPTETPMASEGEASASADPEPTSTETIATAPPSSEIREEPAAGAEESNDRLSEADSAEQAAREAQIKLLLKKAEIHEKAYRLTIPDDNNAVLTYRRVLHQQPGHPTAVAGIERIIQRYRERAQRAVERKNWGVAAQNYSRLLWINPEDADARAGVERLEQIIHGG